MSRFIAADDAFREWEKDPAFRAEYDSLESEFTLATALIKARSAAHMTQEDRAPAMGTSQEAIARLESGKSLDRVPRRGVTDEVSRHALQPGPG